MRLESKLDRPVSKETSIAASVGCLIEGRGDEYQVVKATSKKNHFATKHSSQIVTLVLADGSQVEAFVKWAPSALESKTSSRPDKELRIYRDLLADEPATPCLIGWIRDKEGFRLVLEHVDGLDLRYHDLGVWAEAVAALARLHATMMRDTRLKALDCLIVRDAALLREEAYSASSVLRASCGDAAMLKPLLDGYDRILEAMAGVPTTLVHGDLAPKNVLAAATDGDYRIRFVDWEWAGVGCGFVDLVDLLFGLDRPDWERLAENYLEEAAMSGLLSGGETTTKRALVSCEAQRYLWRISRGVDWGVGRGELMAWARRALDLYSRL